MIFVLAWLKGVGVFFRLLVWEILLFAILSPFILIFSWIVKADDADNEITPFVSEAIIVSSVIIVPWAAYLAARAVRFVSKEDKSDL